MIEFQDIVVTYVIAVHFARICLQWTQHEFSQKL